MYSKECTIHYVIKVEVRKKKHYWLVTGYLQFLQPGACVEYEQPLGCLQAEATGAPAKFVEFGA